MAVKSELYLCNRALSIRYQVAKGQQRGAGSQVDAQCSVLAAAVAIA